MTGSSAYIITHPDDKIINGARLLCVDLSPEQSQLVSDTVTSLNSSSDLAIYVWRSGDPVSWLLDKKDKSDIILINADSIHQSLIGFLSAYKKSYYFGVLKDLSEVNNKAIYSVDFFYKLMEEMLNNDEKLY
jgi:hypothetical protein